MYDKRPTEPARSRTKTRTLLQSIEKIVSGGQTGVDRAALDFAMEQGVACGGWCPKGRRAEDGPIAARYPLNETPTSNYPQRTEWNVRDSDGTLILCLGAPSGGTKLTIEVAERLKKPVFVQDITSKELLLDEFRQWIQSNRIKTLNVAGPRESHAPGTIEASAKRTLSALLLS